MAITLTLEGDDEARVSVLVDSGAARFARTAVSDALRQAVEAHPEAAALWRSVQVRSADTAPTDDAA